MKKMYITKTDIIEICELSGFHLDYDQWEVEGKEWMRFTLKEELDEKELRLIWYKDIYSIVDMAKILFKAGQKAYRQRINEYVEL